VLSVAAYAAGLALTMAVMFAAVDRVAQVATIATVAPVSARAPALEIVVLRGSMTLTQDDWAHQMRETGFWSKRRSSERATAKNLSAPSRVGLQPTAYFDTPFGKRRPLSQDDDDASGGGNFSSNGTYRTVCVRLCDGSFTPVSFATTRDQFEADSKRCEASCSGQAKLYVYQNPGSNQDDMEDLQGTPYKKLPTAFLYKTKYDAQCKCRPHPWEETSLSRHKVYALEAAKAKGSKAAGTELAALNAKIRADEAAATAARLAEVKRLADERKAAAAKKASDAKAAALAKKQAKSGGQTGDKTVSASSSIDQPRWAVASSVATRQSILVSDVTPKSALRRRASLPPLSTLPNVKMVTIGTKTVALPTDMVPVNKGRTSPH
jgi:hypothetical protein